jgi:protein-disulfide isomerase
MPRGAPANARDLLAMRRFAPLPRPFPVLAIVLPVLAAGCGGRNGGEIDFGVPPAGTPGSPFAAIDPATDLPIAVVPERPGAPSLGPADAPLHVVVFTDLECFHCRRHHRTLAALRERYGDRMRLTVRHYPLASHRWAALAAEAAVAAERADRFWEFLEHLWAPPPIPPTPEAILEAAAAAGLDPEALREDLRTERNRPTVEQDVRDGWSAGVRATPTTFFNGRCVVGAESPDRLAAVCEALLASP